MYAVRVTTPLSGDLRELSFAHTLAQLARAGATGVLEVHDLIGINRAFFLDGAPQGAKLTRLKNPLGRVLVDLGIVGEHALHTALDVHNKTEQLLGQVLLEQHMVDRAALNRAMQEQSRRNLLSLFAAEEGRVEFREGVGFLVDFVAVPMSPIAALYEGVRDYAGPTLTEPLLARLAFSALRLNAGGRRLLALLPIDERAAVALLDTFQLSGELARQSPLHVSALAALLFALHELGGLEITPAR